MTSFSNVKPLYEGFVVTINGREWTVNIMILGKTGMAMIAGNEFEKLRWIPSFVKVVPCPTHHYRGRDYDSLCPFSKRYFNDHYSRTEFSKVVDRNSAGIEDKHFQMGKSLDAQRNAGKSLSE